MNTAKLFSNGGSQAVRLPMNCRFPGKEVGIVKTDDCVILFPLEKSDEIFLRGLADFTDDFMSERNAGNQQRR